MASQKPIVVLDIGSSSVHGAIAVPDAKGVFDIKKVSRSHPLVLPEVNLKKLWKKVHEMTEEVLRDLDSSKIRAHHATVIFSSPWYFSEVRRFVRTSDTPLEVSPRLLESFVADERAEFQTASLAQFRVSADEVSMLEPEVMRIRLNGYPAEAFAGKRAREIEAFMYVSAVFGRASEDVTHVLHEHGINEVAVQTSPFAFYRAIQKMGLAEEGRVVVDVGGEITEVSLIRNGILYDNVSYARGFNYVARRLAESFSMDLEAAILYLQNYGAGKLEDGKSGRTQKIILEALGEWSKLLGEAFEHLASKGLLPERAMIAGPGGVLAEFASAVGADAFKAFTIFGRPFTVETLSTERLRERFTHIPSVFSNAELANLLIDLFYSSFRKA